MRPLAAPPPDGAVKLEDCTSGRLFVAQDDVWGAVCIPDVTPSGWYNTIDSDDPGMVTAQRALEGMPALACKAAGIPTASAEWGYVTQDWADVPLWFSSLDCTAAGGSFAGCTSDPFAPTLANCVQLTVTCTPLGEWPPSARG